MRYQYAAAGRLDDAIAEPKRARIPGLSNAVDSIPGDPGKAVEWLEKAEPLHLSAIVPIHGFKRQVERIGL